MFMNVTSYALPVISLVLAGAWTIHQRQTISTFEDSTVVLKRSIAAARSSSRGSDSSHASPVALARAAKDNEPLDWKKISAEFATLADRNGEVADPRAFDRIAQQIQSMNKEELIAALDQIAALDFTKETRTTLDYMVIESLIAKDLELGLACYADRIQGGSHSIVARLSEALQKWAETEPAKAGAWLNKQIDAGKFDSQALDGRSRDRGMVEGALIGVLLRTSPEAAARRLSAMPPEQRTQALEGYSLRQLSEENHAAFAKLVRDQIPENEQTEVFAKHAEAIGFGGKYAQVTDFLNRISATPAERIACLEAAAKNHLGRIPSLEKISHEDLDTLHQWIQTEASDSPDSLMGKALSRTLGLHTKSEFAIAAEIARYYQGRSGSDEVIQSFLANARTDADKQDVRALAAMISDPARREEILKRFQ